MVETFKVGDIVRLNSGGPAMTIYEATDYLVKLVYYNKDKQDFTYLSVDNRCVHISKPDDLRPKAF